MNDPEFQKFLDAKPPLVIKIDWVPAPLILDKNGFGSGWGPFKSYYLWKEVSEFTVKRMFFLFPAICFDNGRRGILPFLCRLVNNGYNGQITCKMSFEPNFTYAQLAQLMNHWRIKALGQS